MIEMPKTRWAVTVDGAYIAYQDVGEGPHALVLIHGWWSHLELTWEDSQYVRFMDRLSRRMRVLVFDKRGTGMSDRFTDPPHLEARMDDVRAVMDAAGVERAALLGWGTGGPQLGCVFAATLPERTVALCINPNVHEPWTGEWGERDRGSPVATAHANSPRHLFPVPTPAFLEGPRYKREDIAG